MKSRTILLGAGASKEADVPVASELLNELFALTDKVQSQMHEVREALEVALAGLRFNKPRGVVDIEDLYQVLVMLADRAANPISPFVGAWNEAISRVDRARARNASTVAANALTLDLNHAIQETLAHYELGRGRGAHISLSNFAKALQDALAGVQGGATTAFESAADLVLRFVFDTCWIGPEKTEAVSYLRPLVEYSFRESLWIATLNYDNSIERAAAKAEISVDLGIESTSRLVKFNADSKLCLAKLHGSVDWILDPSGALITSKRPSASTALSAAIFGAGNKLQVEGPYLDLLIAFRNQLSSTNKIDICGYSFRDSHINYLIYTWLESDPRNRAVVVDPYRSMDELSANIAQTLKNSIRNINWRATGLLPKLDKSWVATRFTLVNASASEWIRTEFSM